MVVRATVVLWIDEMPYLHVSGADVQFCDVMYGHAASQLYIIGY